MAKTVIPPEYFSRSQKVMPDLVLADITTDPDPPRMDDRVYFTATPETA